MCLKKKSQVQIFIYVLNMLSNIYGVLKIDSLNRAENIFIYEILFISKQFMYWLDFFWRKMN